MISRSTTQTGHGSRYLQQLCKHWSHRFAVTFDPQAGEIDLGAGRVVRLTAQPDALQVEVSTEAPAAIDRLEEVVASHLEGFAFREALKFTWVRDERDAG